MKAGESQRRAEEHFDQLVEGVSDYAIFLLDPAGHVASWNAGAERIKGYDADEILGQHFSRFYPEEAVRSGWPEEELRRAAADGRFEDEGWRLRKDGSRFWANVVITALRDESGGPRGFLKITRDLTATAGGRGGVAAGRGGHAGPTPSWRAGSSSGRRSWSRPTPCCKRRSPSGGGPRRRSRRPTGARTSSSPCSATSCATRWPRSATPCGS